MVDSSQKRLLIFDLLRIVTISLIVFIHILSRFSNSFLTQNYLFFDTFFVGIGVIGTSVFILVSGSVLEYTFKKINTVKELLRFYSKRVMRLYPAYWMSLFIVVCFSPIYLYLPWWNLLIQSMGFMVFAGLTEGFINDMGRFIGLIFFLYMLFPFLSMTMKKYPYHVLALLAIATFGSRYLLISSGVGTMDLVRWLPICNLLAFGIGIFIVQKDLYPKWTYKNKWILWAANISFYVFLLHPIFYPIVTVNLPVYFILVIFLSTLVMWFDIHVQQAFRRRPSPTIS